MNILVLGANGQIARQATSLLLDRTDARLTLYLRGAGRLKMDAHGDRVRIVEADVLDEASLLKAMAGQDVVYANLSGAMEQQARAVVRAMTRSGLKRLIFVSSMGIYGEVPGQAFGSILDPYRKSVEVIEASDLDYTVIRPAWLDDKNEISYGTTMKGEPFANPTATVSRKSVADLVLALATDPHLHVRDSVGIHGLS